MRPELTPRCRKRASLRAVRRANPQVLSRVSGRRPSRGGPGRGRRCLREHVSRASCPRDLNYRLADGRPRSPLSLLVPQGPHSGGLRQRGLSACRDPGQVTRCLHASLTHRESSGDREYDVSLTKEEVKSLFPDHSQIRCLCWGFLFFLFSF